MQAKGKTLKTTEWIRSWIHREVARAAVKERQIGISSNVSVCKIEKKKFKRIQSKRKDFVVKKRKKRKETKIESDKWNHENANLNLYFPIITNCQLHLSHDTRQKLVQILSG